MKTKKSASKWAKLVVSNLILLFVLALVACGQEQDSLHFSKAPEGTLRASHADSVFDKYSFLNHPLPGFHYAEPFVPSQFSFWKMPDQIDLIAPWKLQLSGQEKYRAMHVILGSLGLGAAGYVAYEHVKKYGLK